MEYPIEPTCVSKLSHWSLCKNSAWHAYNEITQQHIPGNESPLWSGVWQYLGLEKSVRVCDWVWFMHADLFLSLFINITWYRLCDEIYGRKDPWISPLGSGEWHYRRSIGLKAQRTGVIPTPSKTLKVSSTKDFFFSSILWCGKNGNVFPWLLWKLQEVVYQGEYTGWFFAVST